MGSVMSPSVSSSFSNPHLRISVWQLSGNYDPLCGWLLPLSFTVEDSCGLAAMYGHSLCHLPLKWLPVGPHDAKVEAADIPFVLWMFLVQMLGKSVRQFSLPDAFFVLTQPGIGSVPTLSMHIQSSRGIACSRQCR